MCDKKKKKKIRFCLFLGFDFRVYLVISELTYYPCLYVILFQYFNIVYISVTIIESKIDLI